VPPDIRRADSAAVHVTQWHVPDRAAGTATVRQALEQWSRADWPAGLLSFSAYLNTEGDTTLTYTQTDGSGAHRGFAAELNGLAGAGSVDYTLHRSIVLDTQPLVPAAFVVASFDTDGPGPQRAIVDSVSDALERAPASQHPGMISANFHLSADGSRVLNYAEWTSDEAHIAFLEGATRAATLRATHDTPGVRPIGFRRYRLVGSLIR
jgi:hypothetical protein